MASLSVAQKLTYHRLKPGGVLVDKQSLSVARKLNHHRLKPGGVEDFLAPDATESCHRVPRGCCHKCSPASTGSLPTSSALPSVSLRRRPHNSHSHNEFNKHPTLNCGGLAPLAHFLPYATLHKRAFDQSSKRSFVVIPCFFSEQDNRTKGFR